MKQPLCRGQSTAMAGRGDSQRKNRGFYEVRFDFFGCEFAVYFFLFMANTLDSLGCICYNVIITLCFTSWRVKWTLTITRMLTRTMAVMMMTRTRMRGRTRRSSRQTKILPCPERVRRQSGTSGRWWRGV